MFDDVMCYFKDYYIIYYSFLFDIVELIFLAVGFWIADLLIRILPPPSSDALTVFRG